MKQKILSRIFLDVYNNFQMFNNKKTEIILEDYVSLEETLEKYLVDILGNRIKYNYEDNFREIIMYFENIFYNSQHKNYNNIIACINSYKKEFIEKKETHKYLNLFINTIEKLYSKSYDGKLFSDKSNNLTYSSIAIVHRGDSFIIGRLPRKDQINLPTININNIDEFEKILQQYIDSIKNSDSFYNLFDNENYDSLSFENKVQIIFECTILNATANDLNCVENFFRRYNSFINDKSLENMKNLQQMGELFNDELYIKLKKSGILYETPYYFAFFLRNNRVELPNVRFGIEERNNKKIAHIIATQSSQGDININNLEKIQAEIKKKLPTEPYFRNYNPTHLISILMSFGILNGVGIKDIQIKDYLPFRYNKTILDKQMSEEEADKYQTRLTNQNIMTYMRLCELVEGINIVSYPEMDMGLILELDDEINCKNKFLQEIYDMGYQFGLANKSNFNKK